MVDGQAVASYLVTFIFGKGVFIGAMTLMLVSTSPLGIRIFRPTIKQTVKGPSTTSVSMHRMLKRFVLDIAFAKHMLAENVEEAPYRVFKPLEVRGSTQFTFTHGANTLFDGSLSLVSKVRERRKRDDDWLPFGCKVDPTKLPKTMPEEDATHSSDDNSEERPPADVISAPSSLEEEKDQEDGDGSHDSDHMPPPLEREPSPGPGPDAPPLAFGIVGFDFAPSSRASCFVCKAKVAVDSLRIMYRQRAFAIDRYCHPRCAHVLPAATRRQDFATLQSFMVDPNFRPADSQLLDEVIQNVNPDKGTGSASAAAPGG